MVRFSFWIWRYLLSFMFLWHSVSKRILYFIILFKIPKWIKAHRPLVNPAFFARKLFRSQTLSSLNTVWGHVKCIQDWLCDERYGPTRRQKPNGLRIWCHLEQGQNTVGLSFYPSHLAQSTSKLKSHAGISCRLLFLLLFLWNSRRNDVEALHVLRIKTTWTCVASTIAIISQQLK